MAMTINTNVASLNAQRQLRGSGQSLAVAMQRLSSGLRVNSAKDDAAGLAIAERMRAQTNGLAVAARNANDGISLAQTAEGALGKMGDMLQRMRELAVQSANATNSDTDRAALQAEVRQMVHEIDRVAKTTSFNEQKILNGSFNGAVFQVGSNAGDHLTVAGLANAQAAQLGSIKFGTFTSASLDPARIGLHSQNIDAGQLRIQVGAGKAISLGAIAATTSGQERLGQVVAAINSASSETGVTAHLVSTNSADSYQIELRSASDKAVTFVGFSEATTGIGRALTVGYQSEANTIATLQDTLITAKNLNTLIWTAIDGAGPSWSSGAFDLAIAREIRHAMDSIAGPGRTLEDEHHLMYHDPVTDTFSGKFWEWVATVARQLDNAIPDGKNTWYSHETNPPSGWRAGADLSAILTATQDLHVSFLNAATNVQQTLMQDVEDAFTALSTADASNFSSRVGVLTTAMGAAGLPAMASLTLDPADDLGKAIGEAMASARNITESGFAITLVDIDTHHGIEDVDISTQQGAWDAMLRIDSALDQVSSARGQLGALQTRFEKIVENIGVMHENLSAARGRIVDADYAVETARLSSAQILQQAGVAMVAQANQLPRNVLQLLR